MFKALPKPPVFNCHVLKNFPCATQLQSSLVQPNNCSLQSALCAAVCTQSARIPLAQNGTKYSLIDRGYLLKNPLLSFTTVRHYIKYMASYFHQEQICLLQAILDSQETFIPSSADAALPLLCEVSLFCSKAFSGFNEGSMGKQAVWGPQLLTGFIGWEGQKNVTKISSNDKHRNNLVGGKTPFCFKRSSLCAHCWYGSPMRRFRSPNPSSSRPQKKDLFGFLYALKLRGKKKKQETNRVF